MPSPKKPVTPTGVPALQQKDGKPSKADKAKTTQRLKDRGVHPGQAKHLSGEDEDLTREEIARRRIEWQRTLPRATSAEQIE